MNASLQITGCQVYLNREENARLKGFASIVFNQAFAVRDLKIIQGPGGLFVAMPSRRGRDGIFHDLAHPIVAALREHIESIVLSEYEKARASGPSAVAPRPSYETV